ncbi:uncharacterized protein [Diadema antillarum]|uniref:uncharacterized protein n=1 Tax=Diadema antillarum TaxID=105358 RepID=UPI003A894125
MLLVLSFLLVLQRASSQACPANTPSGCRCENRVFNCSGVGLREIPLSLSSIATSTDYDVIDLSDNNLVSVPTEAFKLLANIQSIILARNQITTVSPGAFDVLASLTTVNLQANSLTTLQQTSFNLVQSLQNIYLDDNSIACDSGIHWLRTWMDTLTVSSSLTGDCVSGGTISSYVSAQTVDGTATVSFEEADFSASEGDGVAAVVIVRTGMTSNQIRYDLTSSDGSAVANVDFIPPASSQLLLEGQTRATVEIQLIDDSDIEADETLTVSLSITQRGEGNQAVVGALSSATVTILDNDATPKPTTTPKPETTPIKPEPTSTPSMTTPMTTKPQGTAKSISAGVNPAAIVVPILLVLVIIGALVAFYIYRQRQVTPKTTAGVRYAAVQNKGKVYGDVTVKA